MPNRICRPGNIIVVVMSYRFRYRRHLHHFCREHSEPPRLRFRHDQILKRAGPCVQRYLPAPLRAFVDFARSGRDAP